jgi:hypothetical protein
MGGHIPFADLAESLSIANREMAFCLKNQKQSLT